MKGTFPEPVPVVVIGSGVGGLSMAVVLALAGYPVTVVEKNARPGGLMGGYHRKGFPCDVGVHYLGALGEGQILRRLFDHMGVTDALPLERMGRGGVIDRYIFDDRVFDLPEGLDAYEANLRAAFPDEGAQIAGIMARLRGAADLLGSAGLLTGEGAEAGPSSAYFDLLGDFLDDLGCSPGLKAVLSVPSCWIGVPADQCPVFYHHMALVSYLLSSWRLTEGGPGMATVLIDRLRELGGRLISGNGTAEVATEGRTVTGVRLASGETLTAPVVVGAVHPATALDLLPEGAAPPLYRKRIGRLRNTHSILGVQAAVDADALAEIPHNIFRIRREPDGSITDMRFLQARRMGRKGETLLSILGAGRDAAWEPWTETRTGHRGPEYAALKRETAMEMIRDAEPILGPIPDPRILDVYTPLTLRDWVATPEGSAYGVLRSGDQLFSAALLSKTPVKGLFLAGQSVLAPGVLGTVLGAFVTARFILGPKRYRAEIVEKLK